MPEETRYYPHNIHHDHGNATGSSCIVGAPACDFAQRLAEMDEVAACNICSAQREVCTEHEFVPVEELSTDDIEGYMDGMPL